MDWSYHNCYDLGWGRHRGRTRPTPGNHDWDAAAGAPYFSYFGVNAGPSGLGYFSYDLGSWHIVSLNSNVPAGEGSAQIAWLAVRATGRLGPARRTRLAILCRRDWRRQPLPAEESPAEQ